MAGKAGIIDNMADNAKFTSKTAIKALSTDFAISNEEHRAWALEFIADLFQPILSSRARKEGFLPDYQVSVWSAGNESPKKIETHDGERVEVAESKYLFPSDVIMLMTELAEKANVPHYSADYYLDQARVSENQFSEKMLGAGGASPLYQLAQSFPDLSQVLAKWDKSTEEGEAKTPGEIPAEDDQRNVDQTEVATANVPAGGGVGSDASTGEAGDGEAGVPPAETQPTPEQTTEQQTTQVAQRKATVERESRAFLTREQAKAVRYESAWIYHHAAFELFGEAGFLDNNQLDQRFNILDTEVKKYFQFNSDPEQLKSLFANPVERLRALQRIYTNLAANPEFATLQAETKEAVGLGEVATAQARELEKRLPSRDKSTFSTLFEDKKLASQIVQAELANKLESVVKVDGARLINLGYSIDAVAMGLGSPQLAAQLNLPTSDKKDVQTFLESLDGEKINMIFFGGQLTKEEEKIIDQKENGVLIKKILAGALTARAIDISTISESIRILSGVATEAELELLVQALPSASIPNVRNAIASSDKLEDTDGTEITSRALTKNITQSRREFELQANKIWQSLSIHAQEWAYAEWLGIGPADIELIRGTDQHLPFNKILAGLNWDEFVKNARKLDQSLKKLDGSVSDLAGLRQISKELRSLNVSELLRDSWIKQYLNGLSKEQLAFLAKTQFIKKVERALALAEATISQQDPSSPDWEGAVRIVQSSKNLVDNEQISLSLHPTLGSEYLKHLGTIKSRQAELAAQIEKAATAPNAWEHLPTEVKTDLKEVKKLVYQAETLSAKTRPSNREWQTTATILDQITQILNKQSQAVGENAQQTEIISRELSQLVDRVNRVRSKLEATGKDFTSLGEGVSDEALDAELFNYYYLESGDTTNLLYELVGAQAELERLTPATDFANPDANMLLLLYSSPEMILAGSEDYNQAVGAIEARSSLGVDEPISDTEGYAGAEGDVRAKASPAQPINVANKAKAAAENMAQAARVATLAARAGAGDLTAAAQLATQFAAFWSNPENRQKVYNILGGVIGGGIGAIIAIISRIMGVVGPVGGAALGALTGGGIGFLVGGPVGALIGGGVGGAVGYLAGEKLAAKYALEGIADLYPSQLARAGVGAPNTLPTTGSASSELGSSIGAETTNAAPGADGVYSNSIAQDAGQSEFIGPRQELYSDAYGNPLDPTNPYAGQSATTASASSGVASVLSGAGAIFAGPAIALGAIYLLTIGTIFTIYSAFLVPQPVGDSTARNANASEYLEFYKTANPKSLPNDSVRTVEYKIVIKPLRGHQILITDVQDEFTFDKNTTKQPDATDPSLDPSSDYLPSPPTTPQSSSIILSYSITMAGGRDVLVRNTAKIKYNVFDSQGNLVIGDQSLDDATASVRIGNPQANCWPTSGTITQLPFGNFSHDDSDAYDIAARTGTKVYSPFAGKASRAGSIGSGGYGLYIILDTDSGTNGSNVGSFRFAHLSRIVSKITTTGVDVEVGELIGYVGNTGNSTGPHLHYERIAGGGLSLRNLVPETPRVWQRVYTCF